MSEQLSVEEIRELEKQELWLEVHGRNSDFRAFHDSQPINRLVRHIDALESELASLRAKVETADEDKSYLLRLVNSAYSYGTDSVFSPSLR